MFGIVWGALIGGTATPAGCGPNVLAMQYVRDMAHMDVSFAQWMAVGSPRRHDHGPPRLVLPHEAVPAGIP